MNYALEMHKEINGIPAGTGLLLHACCGPCSSSVLERLAAHFRVTVYYYNPNIWPPAEYRRRAGELAALLERLPLAHPVALVEAEYDPAAFYKVATGLEAEPERGRRCEACFRLRLEAAARYAKAEGFGWMTTTLTVSPHKNAALLNEVGQAAAEQAGIRFLPSDFKKADGYKRSLELSAEYGLYRQDYCGCEFSARAKGI